MDCKICNSSSEDIPRSTGANCMGCEISFMHVCNDCVCYCDKHGFEICCDCYAKSHNKCTV